MFKMRMKPRIFPLIQKFQQLMTSSQKYIYQRYYHAAPFFDFYQQITGHAIPKTAIPKWKNKHPNLDIVSQEQLQRTLKTLQKFGITPLDACKNPHLFSMNPISMDNYGEILRECGFRNIAPLHIIRYHTIVRSRTISQLKKEGLLEADLNLEEVLHNCFQEWPDNQRHFKVFPDSRTSILTIRVYVLEQYLQWRLSVTESDFKKYCRNYLPLKHRPMSDIKEALNIAQNYIKFDTTTIRRNGFIISSDPVNTKLILENVDSLAGLDIREAIRVEPAILKNNYNSLLEIKAILQEFQINNEAQRHCMRIYCMCPNTVRERLLHLSTLREYKVLFSNPRVLSMVVHKVKVMHRLEKIQEAKKQCYSLNHLISSSKIFNSYITNFGDKACGRDITILISSSLKANNIKPDGRNIDLTQAEIAKLILGQLKRHKYWLHTALNVIDENIQFLKKYFDDSVIFNNCHLLLYPAAEVRHYINFILIKRRNSRNSDAIDDNIELDPICNSLRFEMLTDNQVLSFILYEIEKKHHFSGDGVWNKQHRTESEECQQQIQKNCFI